MTMERFKEMSPNRFSPVDIILEWKRNHIVLYHGDSKFEKLEYTGGRLECMDASIDKIVLSDLSRILNHLEFILSESKRVLKKDGRIFISIGDCDGKSGIIDRILTKLKSKGVMDMIAEGVSKLDMVIDKNYILNDHKLYLEIVKLESEYIKKKIAI